MSPAMDFHWTFAASHVLIAPVVVPWSVWGWVKSCAGYVRVWFKKGGIAMNRGGANGL